MWSSLSSHIGARNISVITWGETEESAKYQELTFFSIPGREHDPSTLPTDVEGVNVMQSKESENNLLLTIDPISKCVVAVFGMAPPFWFSDTSALRDFACSLIEEANRLDNYLDSVSRPKNRRNLIPPRYEKKALQDWESEFGEERTNDSID
jgi:hypothetical protein